MSTDGNRSDGRRYGGYRSGGRKTRPSSDRENPVRLSESLQAVSQRIGIAGPDVLGVIFGRWEELVGPAMATHVRPQRLQAETLFVVADHPAWATQVRHLESDIVARVQAACGAVGGPLKLEVRVRA